MIGNHHKIKVLYNLVEERSKEDPEIWIDYGNYQLKEKRNTGSEQAVATKLTSLGIKFRYQSNLNTSKELIEYAMKNKLGCIVVCRWIGFFEESKRKDKDRFDTHAVLITYFDDKRVEFINPNDAESIYMVSRKWFEDFWTGYVLVIEGAK